MNPAQNQAPWSARRRLLATWKTASPGTRCCTVIAAIFIILAAVAGATYRVEDWRGIHAWNNYRRAAAKRGLVLDLKSYIPKDVPDEQNFAATPFIKSWFPKNGAILGNDDYARVTNRISDWQSAPDEGSRRFIDMVAWQRAFADLRAGKLKQGQHIESGELDLESRSRAAPDVLEGLKSDEAAFRELRAASKRPLARYPVNYMMANPWATLMPHLNDIKRITGRLAFKACAELAVGNSDKAFEDVQLIFYLGDSLRDEPFLISYLVRLDCVRTAVQPVWEGLAEHRWTKTQLQKLQSHLTQCDFIPAMGRYFDTERAAGILTVELVRTNGFAVVEVGPGTEDAGVVTLLRSICPSGWYYQEKVNYCEMLDDLASNMFDPAAKTISPDRVASDVEHLRRVRASHPVYTHRIIADMLLPGLVKVPLKVAAAQTSANQAALACALERYRLTKGQFPETLETLTPQFISGQPNDVITGQPYKYRRTDDGQFILYSVGWNEMDEGGMPGRTLFDPIQGDWVWSYAAN